MAKFNFKEITGVIPALLTPFDKDENLDEKGLRALIAKLLQDGVHGLYLTGSTGEGFLMSQEERKQAVEIAMDEVAGRVPVIVHVGAISTRLSLELTHHAAEAGADAISSVPPFYYRFAEKEIIEYYRELAAATELPMIVYNIPLAGLMGYDTILKLAKLPNVIGIKYTATSHFEITRLKSDVGEDFMIYSGADEMALSGLLAGADGIIGSTYNAIPDTFMDLYSAYTEGRQEEARDIMKEAVAVIMQMLSYGSLMAVLKAISRWRGADAGYVRKPFTNFSLEEEEAMKKDFLALNDKMNFKHVGFIAELAKK
ncbi:dihydrodipicolinate synthase family protein [Proteiniclasticum sp. SCR006]|uniref:Dihydrodipicolinate synthase family protein n=1 Tax=Proteiniclasticum aestuarii TaxID=2817862 RepID=A0A939HB96_9CLOT|nr:dihydrodipicolinate synthase family protein [Proteiniclasticum aestuarii]MBO1265150.1 dihydrodipicolinate synthase family protein [Proteiniclasticum aestuarii]